MQRLAKETAYLPIPKHPSSATGKGHAIEPPVAMMKHDGHDPGETSNRIAVCVVRVLRGVIEVDMMMQQDDPATRGGRSCERYDQPLGI